MNMQIYEKEMISYIESLSAQELKQAIVKAGAVNIRLCKRTIYNANKKGEQVE